MRSDASTSTTLNYTVYYSRSGATPLQKDCLRVISFGRFQMWSNTASTGLRTGQFVRNRRSTPLPYTSIYGLIRSQDSIMINNPDLKQHRCYGTVHVRVNSFHYVLLGFLFFSALPSSLNTWHRLHLTLRNAFILQNMHYKPDIY